MLPVLAVAIFTIAVLLYYKWKLQYWKRKNFPSLEGSFLFGNFENPINPSKHSGFTLNNLYREAKSKGWKHCGIYSILGTPIYLPIELDYVKNIFVDHKHFSSRPFYFNEPKNPISATLFAVDGEKWRHLRTNMSPAFTTGKLKTSIPIMVECVNSLRNLVDRQISKNEPVDILEISARYGTDVIGFCGFGVDWKATKEDNSVFLEHGKKLFPNEYSLWKVVKSTLMRYYPRLSGKMGLTVIHKDIEETFTDLVTDIVKYRKDQNLVGDDVIQQLMQQKSYSTLEEITAQCFTFFLSGFDSPAPIISFSLYELGKNQKIQKKLRHEIQTVIAKFDGKFTYEGFQEMKYLDQVITETQRLYSLAPLLERKCTKDYKIPGEDLVIEKGTDVFIPLYGIHHDEEYYHEPQVFNPERFADDAVNSRHKYSSLSFGQGPRNCVGRRFGIMQVKVPLAVLLSNYEFAISKRTAEPLEFASRSFLLRPKGDIFLVANKL